MLVAGGELNHGFETGLLVPSFCSIIDLALLGAFFVRFTTTSVIEAFLCNWFTRMDDLDEASVVFLAYSLITTKLVGAYQ